MGAGEIFQGEGSGGRWGGKPGARGREVGVTGEGSGGWGPPSTPTILGAIHSLSVLILAAFARFVVVFDM